MLTTLVQRRRWDDAYVGGDNFFAWLPDEPMVRVSPDVFVLAQRSDPMPRSFQTWRPGIQPPLVAVEVVSEDWRKDYSLAPEKYDRLGVQ